jgi:hypothetical protein
VKKWSASRWRWPRSPLASLTENLNYTHHPAPVGVLSVNAWLQQLKRAATLAAMKRHASADSRTFWTVSIVAANVVHLWLFFHLPNAHPAQFWITIAIQMIACIGQFWMLGHWFIKRGKKLRWERWMWLFFVPWGFLWYVFEKCEQPKSGLLSTRR